MLTHTQFLAKNYSAQQLLEALIYNAARQSNDMVAEQMLDPECLREYGGIPSRAQLIVGAADFLTEVLPDMLADDMPEGMVTKEGETTLQFVLRGMLEDIYTHPSLSTLNIRVS